VSAGIFLLILVGLKQYGFDASVEVFAPTTEPIGRLLLGDMILPFEAVSLILLASLVGAVYFSKKNLEE